MSLEVHAGTSVKPTVIPSSVPTPTDIVLALSWRLVLFPSR